MRRMVQVLACLLTLATPVGAEVIDIDNATLAKLLEQGVPIVDIRTAPEWPQTGIVRGSHLLTFFDARGRYDAETWAKALSSIASPEDPVILICRTGNRTSPVAGLLDARVGYKKVYNVKHGIMLWIREGRPVVPPSKAASPS
ncbi:MAG: rhodanese-like domain-containing protein [bacterium]|nr:rhodanese-like domain-containing protein [bacterium]